MQCLVGYMTWAQSIQLTVEFRNIRWGKEGKIGGEEVMAVAKSDIAFTHFGSETALKYSFTLCTLQRVHF